jgi:biotin operon repressor
MPSQYRPESRADPFDASMENLRKARSSPRWHPPRPWRAEVESRMVRRFVYQWFTCCDRNKPSGRSWARQLGISHTWLQKLVREFREHPNETHREMGRYGDPTLVQLNRARESSQRMRDRGELRLSRQDKTVKFSEH